MNNNEMKGNWKVIAGSIKEKWGKLTDDDLTQMKGSIEKLQGTLQKRYGFNEEMAKKEVDSFIKTNKLDSHVSDTNSLNDVNSSNVKLSKSDKQGKRKAA